jgi:hypothetical protein
MSATAPQAKLPWHRPVILDVTHEYYIASDGWRPKLEWHRPVILDITSEYRRPTDEQADARHGEIDKYWQQQRKRHAESKPSEPKKVRLAAIRLRELQTIFRDRYGAQLPDDDAGLDDLELLVGYATIAGKKPEHQVSAWAPWCDAAETERLIWSAATYPVWHTPDELAKRVGLRYGVRKRLSIRTIRCIDANSKEREQLRCGNRNKNKRLKRAAKPECTTMIDRPPPIRLTPRQRIVLKMIGSAEISAPALVDRLARCQVFRGASMRQRVHEALNQLRDDKGLIADRFEPSPRGKVRFVWHQR